MGWLDVINVGLNLGNAAISAGNAAKLEGMRRQGATTEAMLAIMAILRDQIFRYKQTAEAILFSEAKSSKIAAASMKFLQVNLDQSSIRPELFSDLSDKEYCANTTRLIRDNSARMFGQLSSNERAEVGRVVEAARRSPDYEYYLANHDSIQSMKAVEPTYNRLASRNSCGAKMWYLVWGVVGLVFPAMMPLLLGDSLDMAGVFALLGLGLYFVGFVVIARFQKSGEFNRAKKVIEGVKANVDVPRMQKLEAEIGGPQQAQRLQGQAQATLDSFLQGAQLLPS